MMVVEGDSPREMSERERLVDGDGGCGPPGCAEESGCDIGPPGFGEDDGGCDGGPPDCDGRLGGGGDDDEIFLLPLTALAMEADDLRWDLSDTAISALQRLAESDYKTTRQDLSLAGRGLFLSPASEKTFWLSECDFPR